MAAELAMVKIVLKGLIISVPSAIGIPVNTLLNDYREMEGRAVPFANFGYRTALDFLKSLTDTLQIRDNLGIPYARPVISSDNAHIVQLVQEQHRSSSTRRRPGTGGGLRRAPPAPSRRNDARRPSPNSNQSRGQFAVWPPKQPTPNYNQPPPRVQPKPSQPAYQPQINFVAPPLYQPPIKKPTQNAVQSVGAAPNNIFAQTLAPTQLNEVWNNNKTSNLNAGQTMEQNCFKTSNQAEFSANVSAWVNSLKANALTSAQPTNSNNAAYDSTPAGQNAAALWTQSIGPAKIANPKTPAPWNDLKSIKSNSDLDRSESELNRIEPMVIAADNFTERNPFKMMGSQSATSSVRRTHFQHDELDAVDNVNNTNSVNAPSNFEMPLLKSQEILNRNSDNVAKNSVEPMDVPTLTESSDNPAAKASKLNERLLKCKLDDDPTEFKNRGYINNNNNSDDKETIVNTSNLIQTISQKYQIHNDRAQDSITSARPTLNTDLFIKPVPARNNFPIPASNKPSIPSVRPSLLQRRIQMLQRIGDKNNNTLNNCTRLISERSVPSQSALNSAPVSRRSNKNWDTCVNNDALPSIEDDDPVFWSDKPDLVTIDATFKQGQIPKKFTDGTMFKLYVSEVSSPYKFWFNLEQLSDELTSLMGNMEYYYSESQTEELAILEGFIKKDRICAAIYKHKWHRARIVDVFPEEQLVKVFYVDYGTVDEISYDQIRVLKKDFIHLETQALRGCLDTIAASAGVWKRPSALQLIELVRDRALYATITHINYEEETMYMVLSETTHRDDETINDQLVLKGHAKKLDTLINMRSKRPYCEVYPTFDMLENGDYPSFDEIGHMIKSEFDFESYEESTMAPSMYGYSSY